MLEDRHLSFPQGLKVSLWVFGFSWRERIVNKGMVHDLKTQPVLDFWADWGKTRIMDLLQAGHSRRAAVKQARLEACVRHWIEGYAGRIAALTASYGQDDLGHGEIHCWTYVNDADVPEQMRAVCEADLYGPIGAPQ